MMKEEAVEEEDESSVRVSDGETATSFDGSGAKSGNVNLKIRRNGDVEVRWFNRSYKDAPVKLRVWNNCCWW